MPIQVVCDVCNVGYTLKDELSGRKVKCKQCQSVLVVPEARPATVRRPAVDRGYHPAFDHDKFLLDQKRISIGERYYVFDEDRRPILYIERPAHLGRRLLALGAAFLVFIVGGFASAMAGIGLEQALGNNSPVGGLVMILGVILAIVATFAVGVRVSPKRHITVYGDDTKAEPLLEILQDRKFNVVRATYTVNCPHDGPLGRMMKNYLYNFFRKRWFVLDPDGAVKLLAKEDSMILSLLRRLLGPLFGVLRTNFIIVRPGDDRVLGEFNRKFTLFDRYVLDLTADPDHQLDRRMAVALAVLLDTGERR